MADEEIREGDLDRPRKKKTPPPDDDDEDEDRPRRRKRRDDDDDDDDDRPRRSIAKDDGSNTALSAVVPIGVSIWALLSLYTALLSCVIPGLGLLGLLFGVLAFVLNKNKESSYGSVTGNIRAIAGIVISLITIVFHAIMVVALLTRR